MRCAERLSRQGAYVINTMSFLKMRYKKAYFYIASVKERALVFCCQGAMG